MNKIVELLIDWDNVDFEELGVDIMSLVDKPAIGVSWQAFSENELEPYTDECSKCKDSDSCDCQDIVTKELLLSKEEEERVLEIAQEVGETIDIEHAIFIDITKDKFSTIGDFLKGVVGLDILGRRGLEQMRGETKYRYAGPPAERNFCKAMQRLNKFYTDKEIFAMSEFGGMPKGRGKPDPRPRNLVWDYKGGVNCKHYWEEVEIFKNGRETVVIQKGRASGLPGRVGDYTYRGSHQFAFSDDEQKIVVGPAMIPDQLIPRLDELGNKFHVFFSKETIKKIAEKFFKEMKHNNTDVNHDDNITNTNTLLESWIVEDPKMDKSAMYGFEMPVGSWMTSYRINDEDTWNKIKAGELNGFSVTGDFIQKAIK